MNPYSVNKLPLDVLRETAAKHQALRKHLGLSQVDLADRAGVSVGSLRRFEQTGEISFASLLRLSHVLHRLEDFEQLFDLPENLERIEKLFAKTMEE
jgi:transcriptional regulator with XRE-family HTH domain